MSACRPTSPSSQPASDEIRHAVKVVQGLVCTHQGSGSELTSAPSTQRRRTDRKQLVQCITRKKGDQEPTMWSKNPTGMISLLASHLGYTVLSCFFGFRRYFRSASRSVRLRSSSGTPLRRGLNTSVTAARHHVGRPAPIPACSAPQIVRGQVSCTRVGLSWCTVRQRRI